MFHVCFERGLVFELGIQHDVVGGFQAGLGDDDFELVLARDDVGARVQAALHLDGVGGAVGAVGVVFEFTHDDVLEHGFPLLVFGWCAPAIIRAIRRARAAGLVAGFGFWWRRHTCRLVA
jgi:hypothetical protein